MTANRDDFGLRDAAAEDVKSLTDLVRVMHGEGRYARIPWKHEKASARLGSWVKNPSVLVAVADRDNELAGVIAGGISDWFFSDLKQAFDLLLFVHPEHRRSRIARALVGHFVLWAKASGAIEATIATSTGLRIEATAHFLRRQGFEHCGGVFKQRLT